MSSHGNLYIDVVPMFITGSMDIGKFLHVNIPPIYISTIYKDDDTKEHASVLMG